MSLRHVRTVIGDHCVHTTWDATMPDSPTAGCLRNSPISPTARVEHRKGNVRSIKEAQMTAQELYQIYAPLWERVLETRPRITLGPTYDEPDLVLEFKGESARWTAEDGSSPDDWRDGVISTCAAALCRVAAEDWLVEQNHKRMPSCGGYVISGRFGHSWNTKGYCPGDAISSWSSGPTIHHALVAACMEVAEAK